MGYNVIISKLSNEFSLKFQKKPSMFILNIFKYDLLMGYNIVIPELPNEFSSKFQKKPKMFIFSV